MAKISFGGVVSDARNKLGDVVYSRNRGGAFARSWFKPPNPRTAYQQANRAILQAIVLHWKTGLTPAQREVWNAFADANPKSKSKVDKGRRSGFGAFASANMVRYRNLATFNDAPLAARVSYNAGPFTTLVVNTGTAHFDLGYTHAPNGNQQINVYITKQIGHGITRLYRGLFFATVIGFGAANPANIWGVFAAFGIVPVAGDHFGVKISGYDYTSAILGQPWYQIVIAT